MAIRVDVFRVPRDPLADLAAYLQHPPSVIILCVPCTLDQEIRGFVLKMGTSSVALVHFFEIFTLHFVLLLLRLFEHHFGECWESNRIYFRVLFVHMGPSEPLLLMEGLGLSCVLSQSVPLVVLFIGWQIRVRILVHGSALAVIVRGVFIQVFQIFCYVLPITQALAALCLGIDFGVKKLPVHQSLLVEVINILAVVLVHCFQVLVEFLILLNYFQV